MAKERVLQFRNVGTAEAPIWEVYYVKTVADAVLMSDADGETKNIKQYVDDSISGLVNGAPEAMDTLKELADAINANEDVVEAINAAIGNKADKEHTHADATETASGFMSAADKTKLTGIEAGAEVNQNAFASVKVGDAVISADGKTAQLEFVNGRGISITKDENGKIVVAATGIEVGDASTTEKGIVKLNSATDSDSETEAATPKAVKVVKTAADEAKTAADNAQTAADEAKAACDGKPTVMFASALPENAPAGSICFITQ